MLPASRIMLTDIEMHDALSSFVKTHSIPADISFIQDKTFQSVTRTRTLMPLKPLLCKYDRATTLELRGEWHYPMMMMNDYEPLDPDPSYVIVRDVADNVLYRFRPKCLDDVHLILRNEVFDIDHMQQRHEEHAREQEIRRQQNEQWIKRLSLNAELKRIVESCVAESEMGTLAKSLASKLKGLRVSNQDPVLGAFDGGRESASRAVAQEVERQIHLALVKELGDA